MRSSAVALGSLPPLALCLRKSCTPSSHQLSEHTASKDPSFFIFVPSALTLAETLGYFELRLPLATVLCLFEESIQKIRQYLRCLTSRQLSAVSPALPSCILGGLGDPSPAIHWDRFQIIVLTPPCVESPHTTVLNLVSSANLINLSLPTHFRPLMKMFRKSVANSISKVTRLRALSG